jgi:transposase-like protein
MTMADKDKSNITWTDDRKLAIANLASQHEAYKITNVKMTDKWAKVIADAVALASGLFNEWKTISPNPKTVETAFNRWMKEILKKYGVSDNAVRKWVKYYQKYGDDSLQENSE